MMKLSIKAVIKLGVKGILKITDKALIGGVYHNITEETKVSEKGAFDLHKFTRTVIGSTMPIILLISLLKGWVTIEQVKSIIKVFGL